jgi:hypothetical protein
MKNALALAVDKRLIAFSSPNCDEKSVHTIV